MPERQGDKVFESTTEARAAVSGTGTRWVLAIGTAGAVIILVLLWLYYFT